MAVLLAPVVLFSMARSPNALFSLAVVVCKRVTAMGVVEGTTHIGKERERPTALFSLPSALLFKGEPLQAPCYGAGRVD